MPITAVTVLKNIYKVFTKDLTLRGLHYGHTTTGHAASCAAALGTINIVYTEQLAEQAFINGTILHERFSTYTGVRDIVDVRVFGLVLILEMSRPELAIKFQK